MKLPLMLQVYRTLRHGWCRLTPEARRLVRAYVSTQKTQGGYVNAGGKVDDYYTQFGRVLEAVFCPIKCLALRRSLTVPEHAREDDVYGVFFRFIQQEMHLSRPAEIAPQMPATPMTNAACCLLAMQYQMGQESDSAMVTWLQGLQDENGGFRASELAPVPDLLSTAVALFTLRLIGQKSVYGAQDFIQAHWLDNGAFAPTILDEYSDVEYMFYGLLALGSIA